MIDRGRDGMNECFAVAGRAEHLAVHILEAGLVLNLAKQPGRGQQSILLVFVFCLGNQRCIAGKFF